MNKNEIISEYRQAKNKRAQIDILAELNAVPKERIEAILVEGGGGAAQAAWTEGCGRSKTRSASGTGAERDQCAA